MGTIANDDTRRATAKRCTVPTLRGRTLAGARKLLTKAGCKAGKITRRTSATLKRERVITTTPKAGTRVARGTKVGLVVSRGR